MTTRVLLSKDIEDKILASDPRWEVFRIRVDARIYQRIHEFLFETNRAEDVTVHTSMILNLDRAHEGTYLMCFRDSPRAAMEFKLSFDCTHYAQGTMPDNYHFDLQVDPATPMQTYSIDPIKAQGWC